MSAYDPDIKTLPDGTVVESYGAAHARREADAVAALESINRAATAVVLTVRCSADQRHTLAEIYRTGIGPVAVVHQHAHDDADVRRIRRESGLPIERVQGVMSDPLDAPDDRELEARCRCGGFTLDRDAIRAAVADGAALFVVRDQR